MATRTRAQHPTTALAGELAGIVQVPRLLWHLPSLVLRRRGPAQVVVVLPGRGADDISTLPLRLYLRGLGHDVRGWGLGPNLGRVDALLPRVVDAVREVSTAHGGPVVLVGQSLGGYLAREVARRAPAHVDRVITLGTPLFGRLHPGPIRCPVTAVHSPIDRVVPLARAVDTDPRTSNVTVGSTHFSMGIDPDVWRIVAEALEEAQ